MTKYYTLNPVSCGRADGFDAEVAFKIEDWSRSTSNVITNQRVLKTGFKTREEALEYAKTTCANLESALEAYVNLTLDKYPKAKP